MDDVDTLRALNRHVTQFMGLLRPSYLGSDLTVSEGRVLFELFEHGATTARDLSRRLDIDEGYLSRMVTAFEADGFLFRIRQDGDARKSDIGLTEAGRARIAPLVAASRDDVAKRISGLAPLAYHRLVSGARDVVAGLGGPGAVTLRDLEPGDIGWIISQHGLLYTRDEGFDQVFEALVAEILAAFLRDRDPARERGWIAEAGGHRLGNIFCVRLTDEVAKLRLFSLIPEARGLGLGYRLLDTCVAFARDVGYRRMTLWTHESHVAACRLYEAYGFTLTQSTPVQSFGCDLVEQTWDLDL